jgi:hypothetical protein
MPVAIFLAAAAILGGIVVVAMGRGGELARDRTDLPTRTDFRSWSDVAGYRPPAALLGYQAAATEHALSLIARIIAERDAEIAWLRNRLAEVQPESAAGGRDHSGGATFAYQADLAPGTDQAGTDEAGPDEAGTDPAGTDLVGTDLVGTDRTATDLTGTDLTGGTELADRQEWAAETAAEAGHALQGGFSGKQIRSRTGDDE